MMNSNTSYALSNLSGFDLTTLENDASCIYGLTRELTLSYMNRAWFRFARENGGGELSWRYVPGRRVTDAFAGPQKKYYADIYMGLLVSGEIWQHDYECSSEHIFRLFHQTVYPLRDRSGLLVVNSLRIEGDMQSVSALSALPKIYRDPDDLITGCVHCRRVLSIEEPGNWHRVADWNRVIPENMSHSICLICFDYFYLQLKGSAR